ncbi:DEAD/DEAH box helicase family protein [Runella sp.]|uniref:DEAD/DEAH box helicase n=1 Tax=Runella sp. TaxID=1960881 RepID=UPI0030191B3E
MHLLKDFQDKAVNALLAYTFEALAETPEQVPILLEAPTGSGKTVMMADYLYRLVDELPLQPGLNPNTAFIWIAPNTLHIQSLKSLQKLYADTAKLRSIDLSELSTNPVLNPRDLLFVNWSSVDGMKKIWRKENETNTNLETLIENTKAQDTQLILVIDEAHLSAFTGPQAIAVRNLIKAKVEVMVTATPNSRPQKTVSISRKKVVDEGMIKKSVRLNIGLDPAKQNSDNVHIHLLRMALEKKNELAAIYDAELGAGVVNPLLLIQLPSDSVTLSDEDKNIRETLEGLLSMEYGITTNNGRLAVWLSGEQNRAGLEDMNGFQDVLIFKQAIAQGWDCPRAAVLVSYRNVQSPNFGIQTVGRILRMPHQKHYQNDMLNYGYVYTNIESNRIKFEPSDADFFNYQIANRQADKDWVYDKLQTATIVNDRATAGVLTSVFERKFFNVMEENYNIKELPDFKEVSQEEFKTLKQSNLQAMREKFWEFEIDEHQIKIPTDINLDPYEVNAIMLNNDQMKAFSITDAQFGTMFDRFCYDNITRLNRSKSWKKLRETLNHFAEYYLGYNEFEIRKIYLFPQNKEYLVQHIAKALENFEAWQVKQGNDSRRVVNNDWEVPSTRYFNELYRREKIENHALEPFFEYEKASSPEIALKEFLEKKAAFIDWWYKNGDQGKEHFAVPYNDKKGVKRLFYVDFIIKFKSGKIGLFDTKTKRSDAEAANKHNALLDCLDAENKANTKRELVVRQLWC